MDNNLILFSIILVILIGLAGFMFKFIKKKKTSVDPQDFLKDFTALAITLSNKSMEILLQDKNNYKSEDEFKDALANIVADELIEELEKSELSNIAKLIPREEFVKFIHYVFKVYTKEIDIKSYFIKNKENTKELESETENTDKVNILKDLEEITRDKE